MRVNDKRITIDPDVMGGKPCIRDTRVPVSVIAEYIVDGATDDEILADYPALEPEDVDAVRHFRAS